MQSSFFSLQVGMSPWPVLLPLLPASYGTLLLKEAAPGKSPDKAPVQDEEPDRGEGGTRIVCRMCLHTITWNKARMEVNGKHQHTFFNPQGLVFDLGCFSIAPGCTCLGAPSLEFTWFPGFAWSVAVCRACRSHLGWRYLPRISGRGFHGLILDRLVEMEEGQDPQ